MDKSLSKSGADGVQRYLDRAEILLAVVDQLRKDLGLSEQEFGTPETGDAAFEALRSQVLPVLQSSSGRGDHALKVVMYRVDIPELHMRRTMTTGGLHALAGEVVVRALQKVLTRMRFAGRF